MPELLYLDTQDSSSSKEEADHPLFVAKYDYQSQTNNVMSFKKGDQLIIINDDDDNKDWWFARVKHSGQEGSIPSSYVAKFGSLDVEE